MVKVSKDRRNSVQDEEKKARYSIYDIDEEKLAKKVQQDGSRLSARISGLGKSVNHLLSKLQMSDARRQQSKFLQNARAKRIAKFKKRVARCGAQEKVYANSSSSFKRKTVQDHFKLVQESEKRFVKSINSLMLLSSDWWFGEEPRKQRCRAYELSEEELHADYAMDMLLESLNAGMVHELNLKERSRLVEHSRSLLDGLIGDYGTIAKQVAFRGFGKWIEKASKGLNSENGTLDAQFQLTEEMETDFARSKESLEEQLLKTELQEFNALNSFYDGLQRKRFETKERLTEMKERQREDAAKGTRRPKPGFQLQEADVEKHELQMQLSILQGQLEERMSQLESRKQRRKKLEQVQSQEDMEKISQALIKSCEQAHERKSEKLLQIISQKQQEVTELKTKLKANLQQVDKTMTLIESSGNEQILRECIEQVNRMDNILQQARKQITTRAISGLKGQSEELIPMKRTKTDLAMQARKREDARKRKEKKMAKLKRRREINRSIQKIKMDVDHVTESCHDLRSKIVIAEKAIKQNKRKGRKEMQKLAELDQAQKLYAQLVQENQAKDNTLVLDGMRREFDDTSERLREAENEVKRLEGILVELRNFLRVGQQELFRTKYSKTDRKGKYDQALNKDVVTIKGEVEHHSSIIAQFEEMLKSYETEQAELVQLTEEMRERDEEIDTMQFQLNLAKQEVHFFSNTMDSKLQVLDDHDDQESTFRDVDVDIRILAAGLQYLCNDYVLLSEDTSHMDIIKLEHQVQLRIRVVKQGKKIRSVAEAQRKESEVKVTELEAKLAETNQAIEEKKATLKKNDPLLAIRKMEMKEKGDGIADLDLELNEAYEAFKLQSDRVFKHTAIEMQIECERARELLEEMDRKHQDAHFCRLQFNELVHTVQTMEVKQCGLSIENQLLRSQQLYQTCEILMERAHGMILGFIYSFVDHFTCLQFRDINENHLDMEAVQKASKDLIEFLDALNRSRREYLRMQSSTQWTKTMNGYLEELNITSKKLEEILQVNFQAHKLCDSTWHEFKTTKEKALKEILLRSQSKRKQNNAANKNSAIDETAQIRYDQNLEGSKLALSIPTFSQEMIERIEQEQVEMVKFLQLFEDDLNEPFQGIVHTTQTLLAWIPPTSTPADIKIPSLLVNVCVEDERLLATLRDHEATALLLQKRVTALESGGENPHDDLRHAKEQLDNAESVVHRSQNEFSTLEMNLQAEKEKIGDSAEEQAKIDENVATLCQLLEETRGQLDTANMLKRKAKQQLERLSALEQHSGSAANTSPSEHDIITAKLERDVATILVAKLHVERHIQRAMEMCQSLQADDVVSTLLPKELTKIARIVKLWKGKEMVRIAKLMETINPIPSNWAMLQKETFPSIGKLLENLLGRLRKVLRLLDLVVGTPGKHVPATTLLLEFGSDEHCTIIERRKQFIENRRKQEKETQIQNQAIIVENEATKTIDAKPKNDNISEECKKDEEGKEDGGGKADGEGKSGETTSMESLDKSNPVQVDDENVEACLAEKEESQDEEKLDCQGEVRVTSPQNLEQRSEQQHDVEFHKEGAEKLKVLSSPLTRSMKKQKTSSNWEDTFFESDDEEDGQDETLIFGMQKLRNVEESSSSSVKKLEVNMDAGGTKDQVSVDDGSKLLEKILGSMLSFEEKKPTKTDVNGGESTTVSTENEGAETTIAQVIVNPKVLKVLKIKNQLLAMKSKRESVKHKLEMAQERLVHLKTKSKENETILSNFTDDDKKLLRTIASLKESIYEHVSKIADLEVEHVKLKPEHDKLSEIVKSFNVTDENVSDENRASYNIMKAKEANVGHLLEEKAKLDAILENMDDLDNFDAGPETTIGRLKRVREQHQRTSEAMQSLKATISERHDNLHENDPGPETLKQANKLRQENNFMREKIKEYIKLTEDSGSTAHRLRMQQLREERTKLENMVLDLERKLGKVKKKQSNNNGITGREGEGDADGNSNSGTGGNIINKDDEEMILEDRVAQYEIQVAWWKKRWAATFQDVQNCVSIQ